MTDDWRQVDRAAVVRKKLLVTYICRVQKCPANKEPIEFGCYESDGVFAMPGAVICARCAFNMVELRRDIVEEFGQEETRD